MRDSFDLFSGLFLHNRFAQQEVWTSCLCLPSLLAINQGLTWYFIMQLENLELGFQKVKQKLVEKMNKEEQNLNDSKLR
jgi:sugar phosphate permease